MVDDGTMPSYDQSLVLASSSTSCPTAGRHDGRRRRGTVSTTSSSSPCRRLRRRPRLFTCAVATVALLLSLTRGFATTAESLSLGTSASSKSTSSAPATTQSFWGHVPQGPPDAILGIAQAFRECTDSRKVNICVGAYRDEHGKPWVLPSVRRAEQHMLSNPTQFNKEYLPIEGDMDFVAKALTFAYGAEVDLKCVAGVQTLSGTGACRIAGHFLQQWGPATRTIYIPVPTWGNHWKIFQECGLTTKPYRYYSRQTNGLDMDGLVEDLENAEDNSIVLLHACAHNPTGCDPTLEQQQVLLDLIERKRHVVLLDSAYQGFASGDAERDAQFLRSVVERQTIPVLLAQSFAKNFGLYGERCGTLSVVCQSPQDKDRVMSQLRLVIRPMYSSPPLHGSSIVKTVLSNSELTTQYYDECKHMAERIQQMRTLLVDKLREVGSTQDWSHITSQIGMFAYTGMTEAMCDQLTNKYAIFLTKDGRISLAGLNENNVEYVANAIHSVTEGKTLG